MKMNTYLSLMLVIAMASILVGRTNADEAQDKAAVVEMVESYVAAFNGRDAQAVSEHWSQTGELVDRDGNRLSGRMQFANHLKRSSRVFRVSSY